MTRWLFIVAITGVLSALFLFGLLRGKPDREIASNLIGKHAPDFTLPLHKGFAENLDEPSGEEMAEALSRRLRHLEGIRSLGKELM